MRYFLLIFAAALSSTIYSNVTVYFNYALFSTGNAKPYLETYLTISGKTVKYLPASDGGYQANVNISWKILKGTEIIKASTYNLMSPKATDTLNLPSFIDSQRFSLDNGQYTLELVITDNSNPSQKTSHTEKINLSFKREKRIYNSSIQILESYAKSSSQSVLTKNGYDLIPYNINYYPKTQNAIRFYTETYNLDTLIGNTTKFVYSYYIENSETFKKAPGLTGFQKQNASKVNPLLAQFDITKLPTGNYNLVIEVKDSLNKIQSQKKWFFQRQSDAPQITYDDENIKTIEDFFNHFQSADSLKQFIECLWPISSSSEREWQQTQTKRKEPNIMRSYLVDYWVNHAADTINPLKLWISYYKEVLETNALLKCGKQKGYYTDRGRVYLQYGKPDQRNQVSNEADTYPYEIWQYYRIYDRRTKRFFTNKKFVFVNFAIADDCYKLIHSNVMGEINDERWRFKLMNRTQQSTDLDQTKTNSHYGNNLEDNFNNPR